MNVKFMVKIFFYGSKNTTVLTKTKTRLNVRKVIHRCTKPKF